MNPFEVGIVVAKTDSQIAIKVKERTEALWFGIYGQVRNLQAGDAVIIDSSGRFPKIILPPEVILHPKPDHHQEGPKSPLPEKPEKRERTRGEMLEFK